MIQRLVSQHKRRAVHDGFDLDLTYITENIIAMGLPATTGLARLYRNPVDEVVRFLTTFHKDQYYVYNLCARKKDHYDKAFFAGRVAGFPFEDHGVPPLEMVQRFAESVSEWIDASKDRVACVHCLAGKGRTGLMVCAVLLYRGTLHALR